MSKKESVAVDQFLGELQGIKMESLKNRLSRTWMSVAAVVKGQDVQNQQFINSLPILYIPTIGEETFSRTKNKAIKIPLLGGGSLEFGRKIVNKKADDYKFPGSSTLVLNITTAISLNGKKIKYAGLQIDPDVDTNPQYVYIDYADLKIHTPVEREKLESARSVLALFDPARDIDREKLGVPTPVQSEFLTLIGVQVQSSQQ